MPQMAYSPMHGPEKLLTQEDMWAKLAKHAPTEVQIHLQKAGETPKAELRPPAPLVWLKPVKIGPSAGYVLDLSGRFSISKTSHNGTSFYTAWRRKDPAHESVILGIRLTRAEAERLCEIEASSESEVE